MSVPSLRTLTLLDLVPININVKDSHINLCLGLENKLNDIAQLLSHNAFDILCLQEVEIPYDFAPNLLNLKGFQFELESNSEKSRTGIYV